VRNFRPESSIVPPELQADFGTVSEALLKLEDDVVRGLHLNAYRDNDRPA